MITGIIFVCLIEENICQPVFKEFDTVQECIIDATETIAGLENRSGIVLYTLCDPDSQPT